MRESCIEAYFKARVQQEGGAVRKIRFLDVNGAPDRIMLIPPSRRRTAVSLVWVELKRTGKDAEPHQKIEHVLLASFSQRVEVVNSLEGVDAIIEQYFLP